jgi:hypothetical protein
MIDRIETCWMEESKSMPCRSGDMMSQVRESSELTKTEKDSDGIRVFNVPLFQFIPVKFSIGPDNALFVLAQNRHIL